MDKKFELLAFPDLFPLGRGGYETAEQRPSKLTLRQYFQQRLQNMDGRFARNIEYLFCAQHATDLKQIQSDSNFALHLTRCKTLDGKKITAGMLKDTTMLGRLVKSEQAYKFLKNIRGSPAYWQWQLYEVLAML